MLYSDVITTQIRLTLHTVIGTNYGKQSSRENRV